MCPLGDRLNDRHGQFKLHHHKIIGVNLVLQPGNIFHSKCEICTWTHCDSILSLMFHHFQCDMTHAGGFQRVYQHMGDIHPRGSGRVRHNPSECVVAYLAHHGHMGTQPGALHRLVGALPTGSGLELQSHHRLTRAGGALCRGDQVHHKTADHKNIGFFQHMRFPLVQFRFIQLLWHQEVGKPCSQWRNVSNQHQNNNRHTAKRQNCTI